MAKPTTEKSADQIQTQADDFDFSKFMPEGLDSHDLRKIVGLTPIYSSELAFNQKWNPCCGWMDRILKIEVGDEKDPNPIRDFIRILVTSPTKGVRGDKRNRQIVDVLPGEYILMPMSGGIKTVDVLRAALANQNEVFWGIFRCTGQQDTGKPSEMWVIDARIHPKTRAREGLFALPENVNPAPQLQPQQNGQPVVPGQIVNAQGQPQRMF